MKMTLELTKVSDPFPENRRQSLSQDQNRLFYRSTISFGFRLPFSSFHKAMTHSQ